MKPGRTGDSIWRHARALIALAVLVLGLLVAACTQAASLGPSLPPSPVDGVIIAVDASSITEVRGFTLLTPDGQRLAFKLGALENPTDFPPGHLMEHQATSVPVRVYFRIENGVPVVYRLGDASPPASAGGSGSPDASPAASPAT